MFWARHLVDTVANVVEVQQHTPFRVDSRQSENQRQILCVTAETAQGEFEAVRRSNQKVMAQVALAWLRHQTVPVIPIMGSAEGISTPGQSRQFGSGTLRRTVEIP